MPLLPAHLLPCVASRLPIEGLRVAAAEAALASGHRPQGAFPALSGMALPAPNSLLPRWARQGGLLGIGGEESTQADFAVCCCRDTRTIYSWHGLVVGGFIALEGSRMNRPSLTRGRRYAPTHLPVPRTATACIGCKRRGRAQ